MSISWALYMLGLHEDIQKKAREELDSIILDDTSVHYDYNTEVDEGGFLAKELKVTDITIEHIREMKYLDRVIKELLRMWPSIPFVARQMTQDLMVGKYNDIFKDCFIYWIITFLFVNFSNSFI